VLGEKERGVLEEGREGDRGKKGRKYLKRNE
jgi:hypothetical protein